MKNNVEFKDFEFKPIRTHIWVFVASFVPVFANMLQGWLESPSPRELEWKADDIRYDTTMSDEEKEAALFELGF